MSSLHVQELASTVYVEILYVGPNMQQFRMCSQNMLVQVYQHSLAE